MKSLKIGDTFIWKQFNVKKLDSIHQCFFSHREESYLIMTSYSFLNGRDLVVYGKLSFSIDEINNLKNSRIILFEKIVKKEMILKDNRGKLDKILDRIL